VPVTQFRPLIQQNQAHTMISKLATGNYGSLNEALALA
jgi:hypothetical protein